MSKVSAGGLGKFLVLDFLAISGLDDKEEISFVIKKVASSNVLSYVVISVTQGVGEVMKSSYHDVVNSMMGGSK